MQITRTHKIIISIVALAILLSIYIFIDRKSRGVEEAPISTTSTSTNISNTQTVTNTTGIANISGSGNYSVEQVGGTSSKPLPVPDLNRSIIVYPGAIISPEAKAQAAQKVPESQAILKKNPNDIRAWNVLGLWQKTGGDYEGAVISWKYASQLSTNDYVSVANLGNIYAWFLKDNGQSEIYYKEAIRRAPTQSFLYIGLAEVYRDIFRDLDKARAIVDQGLAKIPNDPSLLQFKANLN